MTTIPCIRIPPLRKRRYERQSCIFWQLEHDIHILDRLTSGPFYDIVDDGQQNDPTCALIDMDGNVAVVGAVYLFCMGMAASSTHAQKAYLRM